jgi:serine/threonine protein kinase
MLKEDHALVLVDFRCVGAWQPLLKSVLDDGPHLCPRLRSLPPVDHQGGAHPFEEVPGNFLHFIALRRAQVGSRSRQQVKHRDLKPANVKVRADGTVKVLDFGLAKALDLAPASDLLQSPTITSPAMTRMGVIMGTAAYMSPEQARGSVIDSRTDIWSFGVVLYEMLTGKTLFEGPTVSDTLASVLRADLEWGRLPSGLPAPVRTLLGRCLQRSCVHGYSAPSGASCRHCGGPSHVSGRPQCPRGVEQHKRTADDHPHDDHGAPSAALRPPALESRPRHQGRDHRH